MPRRLLAVPFADDPLARLADALLAELPGAADGDLSDALVLLPSSRACRDLEHALLEHSGRDALLLPRLLTDTQWADELAAGLGLDRRRRPARRPRSAACCWPAAWPPPPGWRAARPRPPAWPTPSWPSSMRCGSTAWTARLLDGRRPRAPAAPGPDRRRRGGGRGRRRASARCGPCTAATCPATASTAWPTWPPRWSGAKACRRCDRRWRWWPASGGWSPCARRCWTPPSTWAAPTCWWCPTAAAPLDRRLAATWGAADEALDPLAPTRRLLAALGAPAAPPPAADPPLGARLAALDVAGVLPPDPGPRLLVAEDPEHEATAVAGLVARHLQDHGAPARGITVAVNDPALAARITARLRDAGLDADNTVGEPLSALPAGLLLRFMLRAALTDLRAEPLLEVLGHPYTRLTVDETGAGTWALRLERMVRRETGPQTGLAGLHRRARDHDAAALALFKRQQPGMDRFVARVAEAFAPLLGDGRRPSPVLDRAAGRRRIDLGRPGTGASPGRASRVDRPDRPGRPAGGAA